MKSLDKVFESIEQLDIALWDVQIDFERAEREIMVLHKENDELKIKIDKLEDMLGQGEW